MVYDAFCLFKYLINQKVNIWNCVEEVIVTNVGPMS